MTTPAPAAKTQRTLTELTVLEALAGIGIVIGAILIVAGVFNGNGGYFDGPSLGDLATKITLISLGSTIATAGFLALLAALVLGGVRKVVEDSRG